MPHLDLRLKTVAKRIRSATHVDIGSDHGHLLKALLTSGRIERGIAVENKRQPFLNSQLTLSGLQAEVRFGDGLEPLSTEESDSLSICGMGGESIARILSAYPDRIPPTVILQPNKRGDLVRQWALNGGFHLVDEQVTVGHWPYEILAFTRVTTQNCSLPDPAYDGLDRDAALLFGPLMIRRRASPLFARLKTEKSYLENFDRLNQESQRRLAAIDHVLKVMASD